MRSALCLLCVCDRMQVPIHTYNVSGFYGSRGEDPGREQPEQGDYSGYGSGIRCMRLSVRTGACSAGP